MRKRAPTIEWQMAKDDADWERQRDPALPEIASAASRRRRLKYTCWGVAALLLLLTIGGHRWWRTAPGRMQQAAVSGVSKWSDQIVPSAVSNPTDSDWWLQHRQAVSGLRAAVQTADPSTHLDVVLQTVEIQGDQAVAQIVLHTKNGEPVYQQTRFYQRTAAGWLPTEPDAALWGSEHSLETSSFIYRFRQNDAPTVIAVAPQIDAVYMTIRGNFGLSTIPPPAKLLIEVRVTQSPGNANFQPPNDERFVIEDRLIVASPALYATPVELTDTELLAQSLTVLLLTRLMTEAKEQYAIGQRWQPVMEGLRLWQVWDLNLPLATWREDIVQWIYLDQPVVLPTQYEQLCASHALWMRSPSALGIPLSCLGLEWEERYFSLWGLRQPPTHLNQIALPTPNSYPYQGAPARGQTVALATLIEYAVATYGHQHLPTLMTGLGQYDNWDSLIPAVYGVSAAEFEAGWQAYLTAHYGVPARH